MIEIVVVTYNSEVPAQPLSARFDAAGGTIGRGDDNRFILPDPKHHVSRRQAAVVSDGARHWITNLSHANPTLLNGAELPCEVAQPLRAGDEIAIGLYRLQARTVASDCASTESSVAVSAVAAAAAARVNADRMRASSGPAVIAARLTPNASAAGTRTPVQRSTPGGAASASLHQQAAPDAPAAPADAPMTAPVPADPQALLQAFLDGAGIPSITLSSGLTPELMTMIGGLLATAIDGTVDLLGLRALVKREVNAEVTMVVVRNNNPLKFLPDGATVLTQMLRKRMPGFMGPVEAMQDAYDDLHAHQLGMMAGMQASLTDLHARLAPLAVERDGVTASAFERLLPSSRKSRYWDRYCTLHQQTGATLGNATESMGRKAFLSAYERASERYKDEAANER